MAGAYIFFASVVVAHLQKKSALERMGHLIATREKRWEQGFEEGFSVTRSPVKRQGKRLHGSRDRIESEKEMTFGVANRKQAKVFL